MPMNSPWTPASATQQMLLNTTADEVLFGGAAAGGKSDALLGYAMLKGKRSLLLRREYPQLRGLQSRLSDMFSVKEDYRGTDSTWRFPNGRQLMMGSVQHPEDCQKFQGLARDTLLLDELAHFSSDMVSMLSGWIRSAEGRPCRLICASNPPLSSEGAWMVDHWRPWLDPNYPDPALPGELRWFARVNGIMAEVPKGTEGALSRTFIPSKLADNPYLRNTGYENRLGNLPPEMASALLNGDFLNAAKDTPLQAIPSSWIKAAQSRWTPDCDMPLTHLGIDCSRGGRDRTVIVCRHRNWVAEPIVLTREESATGGGVAARVLQIIGEESPRIRVDGIGVGSSVVDHLHAYLGHLVESVINSQSAPGSKGQYCNRRAYDYWSLRQRLDPATSTLQLPPSTDLYSELSAPQYTLSARGIQVQSKEDLIRKLGRSPDIADAVVLACGVG